MEHASYKEVKNLVHNEIGITKEDIREIIREAVRIEAQAVVAGRGQYINKCIGEWVLKEIRSGLSNSSRYYTGVKERVHDMVANEIKSLVMGQLDISIAMREGAEVDERDDELAKVW